MVVGLVVVITYIARRRRTTIAAEMDVSGFWGLLNMFFSATLKSIESPFPFPSLAFHSVPLLFFLIGFFRVFQITITFPLMIFFFGGGGFNFLFELQTAPPNKLLIVFILPQKSRRKLKQDATQTAPRNVFIQKYTTYIFGGFSF